MIIVSDVVTVRERGKYLTLLGIGIAGGSGEPRTVSIGLAAKLTSSSGVGPFIGALLAEKAKWNWVFWMMAPSWSRVTSLSCLTTDRLIYSGRSDYGAYTVHSTSKAVNGQFEGEAATHGLARKPVELDYDRLHSGECTWMSFTYISQVPLSGGGSTFAWQSPVVVTLFIVGGLALATFVWVEAKVARLPLIPGRL